jgi:tripartite-type tricarboxylate transporter receptor subunit TctC
MSYDILNILASPAALSSLGRYDAQQNFVMRAARRQQQIAHGCREDGLMNLLCRKIVTGIAALSAVCGAGVSSVSAQTYPSKPITIVVGFTPGAASDTAARLIGEHLSAAVGQPVVIDNRAGASGNLAASFVARAPADGYTLIIGVDAVMTSNVHLFKTVPFDPVKDFAPITSIGDNIICLAVNSEFPAKSVAEFIAYAKANPGKVSYGSSGVGSPHHLAGELLRSKMGIVITHVPYRGGGAAVNDLIGGHIPAAFLSLSAAVPHIASGKLRVLAVVEKQRYAEMKDVPTVGETVPGFEMNSWLGLFAPAGTPQPVIDRLNAEVGKILKVEEVKAKLAALGLAVSPSTPAQLAEIVSSGLKLRGELVKAAGIQPE